MHEHTERQAMKKIQITIGSLSLSASLLDNQTADAIWEALPFDFPFNTWGDEIYFSIPVFIDREGGQEVVEVGDLAYWPPGHAFCIFFGKTPASTDERPRAASGVSVFGKIEGDPVVLRTVKGSMIHVKKSET